MNAFKYIFATEDVQNCISLLAIANTTTMVRSQLGRSQLDQGCSTGKGGEKTAGAGAGGSRSNSPRIIKSCCPNELRPFSLRGELGTKKR